MNLRRLRAAYGGAALFWLNACLVFVAANLLAAFFHRRDEEPNLWPGLLRSITKRVYPNLTPAELDQLARESERQLVYEPYTDAAEERPVHGRFVNIHEAGFRMGREQGPWPPEPRHYNVFLFGGSTAFGYGLVDDDTVASYLQSRLGTAGGRPVRVYNFGRCGYYSTQERILFGRLLVAGHAPDAAVFLDGLNDFSMPEDVPIVTPWLEGRFGIATHEGRSLATALEALPLAVTMRHAARVLGLAASDDAPPPAPPAGYDDPARADAIIARWVRSKAAIEGVAAAHRVAVVFAWQPIPTYDFPPGRTGWLVGGANGWAGAAYPRMASHRAAHPLGPTFVWCADVGRDGTEELYIDPVHYAPAMSDRVAQCVALALRERGLLR